MKLVATMLCCRISTFWPERRSAINSEISRLNALRKSTIRVGTLQILMQGLRDISPA